MVLTSLEEELLAYLADRVGHTVTRAELLREVWDYSPRSRTRAVANTVARLRSKLHQDASHLVTVYGRGYRLELPDDTGFVARPALLDQLNRAIESHGMVTLHGVGGIGKTRTARALAQRHGRCAWVPAGGIRSVEELTSAVAGALELETVPELAGLRFALASAGPMWLVVDAAEELSDEAWATLCGWVEEIRGLWVVVTSRVWRDGACVPVPALTPDEAVELLTRRATASSPDVSLPEEVALRVVRRLDGVPLAIELAAARLRVMSAESLAARLEASLSLLTAGANPLASVLRQSWEGLEQVQQQVLAAAAQFPSGFDLDALAQVSGLSASGVLSAVEALSSAALVVGREPRFRLLNVVRAFAADRADAQVGEAFVAWAVGAASVLLGRLEREAVSAEELVALEPSLRSALQVASEAAEVATLALALFAHDARMARWSTLRPVLDGLEVDGLPEGLALDVSWARARMAYLADAFLSAESMARAALERARSQGTSAQILQLWILAVDARLVCDGSLDDSEIEALVDYAMVCPEAPIRRAEAFALCARVVGLQGETERAIGLYHRASALLDGHPDQLKVCGGLGQSYRMLGRVDQAVGLLEDALLEARQEGLRDAELMVLRQLADMRLAASDLPRATELFEAIAELGEALGHSPSMLQSETFLALQEPDSFRMEAKLTQVRERAELLGRTEDAALADANIGLCRHERGDVQTAPAAYAAAAQRLEHQAESLIRRASVVWRALALAEQGVSDLDAALPATPPRSRLARSMEALARATLRGDQTAYDDALAEAPEDELVRTTQGLCDRLWAVES